MTLALSRLLHPARRIKRHLIALSRRNKGVALVEFALVAPIMITMYLGMVELSSAVGHSRKNTLVSKTIADLVTQLPSVSNSDMNDFFGATSAILAPYPLKGVTLRVTSVRIDNTGKVFVDWSSVKDYVRSGTSFTAMARCSDGAAMVPAPLKIKNTSLVIAESKITHTPLVNTFVTTFDMAETSYLRPRVSASVGREGVPTTLCPSETAAP